MGQSTVFSLCIPIGAVSRMMSIFHLCLLNALYSFEYKWYNQGLELHKRLSFIESHWPYFLGFGLPLALITSYPESQVVSGCVFSILFPLFLVSQPRTSDSHFARCHTQDFQPYHHIVKHAFLTNFSI